MATKKSQRIAIWVIAAIMLAGTVGGFAAMMVQPGNDAKDQAALEAAQKEYSDARAQWQEKVDAQASALSDKHFADFSAFASRVSAFSAENIDELATEDLRVGDGAEVAGDTKIAVYYIGWNPNGEIFDQSIDGERLKAPYAVNGPATAQVIEGWQEGLIGMKIGGVRELTIPSDMAYGEQGSGEKIPANTPLKFIVMVIEQPEDIPEPDMPERLRKEYERLYGNIGL